MKLYIATDHRGIEIEKQISLYLKSCNYDVVRSTLPHSPTDDYVDFAIDVAKKVSRDNGSFGILICGSGIGMSIAANKVKGIRAARCLSERDAFVTRNDNHSNIVCLDYNQDINTLLGIIETFISTPEDNDERHLRRIGKITAYENGE